MGPAAAPSENLIREKLTATDEWTRTDAAYAVWRVSGDVPAATAILTEVARPLATGHYLPARARALQHLRDISKPTPDVIDIAHAVLTNTHRLPSSDTWRCFVDDEQLRHTAAQLADLTL